MKTFDLTGAALDWAVAEASGTPIYRSGKTLSRMDVDGGIYWQPSTDWSQGGPIIEREEICIDKVARENWCACVRSVKNSPWLYGPTPLIAAMRCYVASKLGEKIEVPKELTI
jgi:hypothetical protein